MRRLRDQSFANSSEAFEEMFHKGPKPDWFDIPRWEKLLKKFKGGKLMDLGCFMSQLPVMAKKKYPESEIWALDQAKEVIEFLAEEYPYINYTVGDATYTDFPNGFFDYVVAAELIEHLDYPEALFKEAFRILKPGGVLAITTPLEETEAGEVDGNSHIWSFERNDIKKLAEPYSKRMKIGTLRSKYFPKYKYHFPYIIAYLWKT